MKTILLAGDSWSSGVWENNRIIHMGIAQHYIDCNYNVINLSQPGTDPFGLLYPLNAFLRVNLHIDIESIFYFQTDIGRAFNFIDMDPTSLLTSVKNGYYDLYQKLNESAKNNNKTFNIIGGLTDVTTDLSTFDNLNLIIPSWCQLVDPSLSTVELMDQESFEYAHKRYSAEQILPFLEASNQRYTFFNHHKNLFWPDGIHPNYNGHKFLFDYLTKNIPNLVAKSK